MAIRPTDRTGSIFPVHVDLRQRVGANNLLRWCLEAPLALDEHALESLRKNPCGFSPPMLLTLLSFCYAAGYYGSEDIVRAIANDRTVRYICARSYPDARVLRRFRRHCRAALDQCLACVLHKAAADFCGAPPGNIGTEPEQQVISTTQEKIELAVIMDRTMID